MSTLYDDIVYKRESCIGETNWIGNLRWYVKENVVPGFYSFECISALKDKLHQECVEKNFTAHLFDVQFKTEENENFEYGADFIKADSFRIVIPFYEYGCILEGRKVYIKAYGEKIVSDACAMIVNDEYYICFKSSGNITPLEDGFVVEDGYLAVTFNVDKEVAEKDCNTLFEYKETKIAESKKFWEDYFDSCPVVDIKQDYSYYNGFSDRNYVFEKQNVVMRQLWHWWCVLINVNDVAFNKNSLYMAPDKTNWKGIWSNDALQCIAALSLTNQKELSKRLIISYLKTSVNDGGVFSWYTHADGVGCYGQKNDVGRFSNGAPYFLNTVEYYIKNTDDASILNEDAGGMTVYEKLKKHIYTLMDKRCNKNYGMIEWANLWETGWDDKGGCFFEAASLKEWEKVISNGTDEEIKTFYTENQRPVIPIVEQVITLWSLYAGLSLADRKKDYGFGDFCKEKAELIRKNLYDKCWNEETGFYHDIDVKKDMLSDAKSADVFYWLYFEKDKVRQERIVEHLYNQGEFDCCQIPMLSRDSKGFDEWGYWSGGHWSREMSMIGMGLKESGYYEKAKEVVIRAIMIAEGCIIPEVINPLTGILSTKITKMACSIMNVLALLHIEDKVRWIEEAN